MTCKYCHKKLKLEDQPIARVRRPPRHRDPRHRHHREKGQRGRRPHRLRRPDRPRQGQGQCTSRGPVLVGPEAEIKGNITAPTLAVAPGPCGARGCYAFSAPKRTAPKTRTATPTPKTATPRTPPDPNANHAHTPELCAIPHPLSTQRRPARAESGATRQHPAPPTSQCATWHVLGFRGQGPGFRKLQIAMCRTAHRIHLSS